MSERKNYTAEYNRTVYKAYTVRLRYDKEADLIAYLESRGASPQNVIKHMIRRSMIAWRRRNNEANGNSGNEQEADPESVAVD